MPRGRRSTISPICLPRPAAAHPRWVSRICPTFMRAGHAQRVEHDVDRRAVLEVRHVLERHDARDHALVAVTAGHLVARLQLALRGDEDLDHLHHARRQLVAALQLVDLAVEAVLQALHRFVELLVRRLDLGLLLVGLDGDLAPLARRVLAQHLVGDARARLQALQARRPPSGSSAFPGSGCRSCAPGSPFRRRGPWPDARSRHARWRARARPCRRRGG